MLEFPSSSYGFLDKALKGQQFMGWSTGLFRRVILAVMTPLAGLAHVRRRSFKCVAVLIVVGLVAGTLVGGLTGVGQPRSFHAASGRSDRSVGTAHQAHLVSTAGEAGQYVPVQAVRICDTRPSNPSGLSGAAAQCNGSGNSGEPIGRARRSRSTRPGLSVRPRFLPLPMRWW